MSTPAKDGMEVPARYWAMLTMSLGITMAVLDGAIANVALPTIAHDLQADPASSIWVVNAYQLAVTVTILPFAALGDVIGYRRIYLCGLVAFTLASAACTASDSLVTLAIARVVQGLGASALMSVNSALIRFIYPRAHLGRGIGINAVVVAASAAVGPTVASGILAIGAWQWLFAINIPIGAVTFIVAYRSLPPTPRQSSSFDVLSAILTALTLGPLIIGIDGAGRGEDGLLVAAEFLVAFVSGGLLVWRQWNVPAPFFPFDLLRIPIFALSMCTSICSFAGQMLAYVALPFLLEGALGFTDVQTGLLMTPWPLAIVFVAPIAGRLSDKYPAGLLGAIGLAIFAVGLALLATMGVHPTRIDVIWRMAVCGIGFGFFQSPNNRTIIGSAPRNRSGGASGMLGTARLVGQTTGAAIVALAFARVPAHGEAFALYIGVGLAAAAAGVSALRMRHTLPTY
ncbi:MAG TPA: MFS transporter [Magnetospirillaceae bacterium]|jgi:DHA2 family multidrug resistance protein-like MFS transporter